MPILTLRPSAAGDLTQCTPSAGDNYACVNKAGSDATYVYNNIIPIALKSDLYNLPNILLSGIINSVTVFVRCKAENGAGLDPPWIQVYCKTGGTAYASNFSYPTFWATYSTVYLTNPQAGGAWTWAQVNALQAGVQLYSGIIDIYGTPDTVYCSQVYVEVDYSEYQLIIRPNAAGTYTQIPAQTPNSTFHYDKVDDIIADDTATTVQVLSDATTYTDTYNLENTTATGIIDWIRVYADCYSSVGLDTATIKIVTGGTAYSGTPYSTTAQWVTSYSEWLKNPKTNKPWTWGDINALEAGIALACADTKDRIVYCTQVYVVVSYYAFPQMGFVNFQDPGIL